MTIYLIYSPVTGQAARQLGFPVFYGDGSRPAVLQSAGISSPKAIMVMLTGKKKTVEVVHRLRLAFPAVIISSPPLPLLPASSFLISNYHV